MIKLSIRKRLYCLSYQKCLHIFILAFLVLFSCSGSKKNTLKPDGNDQLKTIKVENGNLKAVLWDNLMDLPKTTSKKLSPVNNTNGQTVRFAGIVLKWLRNDKALNYCRVEPLIRQAAAHGAQIVCTTECFLDGYAIFDSLMPLEKYRALGEPIPEGYYYRELARLAHELGIYLIAGMLEVDGEQFFNTAALIGPNGELIGKYHKQQIEFEAAHNSAGQQSSVFKLPWGIIGVMICADRRFPEVVKGFCDRGADFLICPSGGMFGPETNDPILQARSKENGKYIFFVHPAEFLVTGPDGTIVDRTILGSQLVISPKQIGTEDDSQQVFYFDVPISP